MGYEIIELVGVNKIENRKNGRIEEEFYEIVVEHRNRDIQRIEISPNGFERLKEKILSVK